MVAKSEIQKFIHHQNSLDTLKFITCGSVDDGKSTLLGRMLYEEKLIFDDQVDSLTRDSKKIGTQGDKIDFALLVDGLAAEREQGITIDVAYRFFSTEKRKFIVADSPGHEQYTRNMITAASNADLAIILVDARNGILTQTKRHSFIVNLMGIKQVIVAINKMDLVNYDQKVFDNLKNEYQKEIATKLDFEHIEYIPISAIEGDSIINKSQNMKWYKGPRLMRALETINISEENSESFSMPVQYVNRPSFDFRGYCGSVSSGTLQKGDEIKVNDSVETAIVSEIYHGNETIDKCNQQDSVTITLNKEIDISRGDVLVSSKNSVEMVRSFLSTLIWFDVEPGYPNRQYILKTSHSQINCEIVKIKNNIDINSYEKIKAGKLVMNDISECEIALDARLAMSSFKNNKILGNYILIDKETNLTVAAGIVQHSLRRSNNIRWQDTDVNLDIRKKIIGQEAAVIWFTGMSGAGKSTISNLLEKKLASIGKLTYLLDGDNLRHGINKDLGFKEEDRIENIRRAGEISKILFDAGIIVLASFISPYAKDRLRLKNSFPDGSFHEIYVKTHLETLKERDTKGLYAKALKGEIPNFTGINSSYEEPMNPSLTIDTDKHDPQKAVDLVINHLKKIKCI